MPALLVRWAQLQVSYWFQTQVNQNQMVAPPDFLELFKLIALNEEWSLCFPSEGPDYHVQQPVPPPARDQRYIYRAFGAMVSTYETISPELIITIVWQIFINARSFFLHLGPGRAELHLSLVRMWITNCAIKMAHNCPKDQLLGCQQQNYHHPLTVLLSPAHGTCPSYHFILYDTPSSTHNCLSKQVQLCRECIQVSISTWHLPNDKSLVHIFVTPLCLLQHCSFNVLANCVLPCDTPGATQQDVGKLNGLMRSFHHGSTAIRC